MKARLRTQLANPIIRTSSFFLKELWAAVRQPRLLMSVVVGPFLILLAFGLGYRGQTPHLRTTLVLPQDPRLPDDPAAYRNMFSDVFVLAGVTRDRAAAEADLAADRTQVVVIAPEGAEEQITGGEHAQFEVLFNQTDPLQAAWVRYFATVAVQELNRRVLVDLVGNGQQPAAELATISRKQREQTEQLERDLAAGDVVAATPRLHAIRQTQLALRSATGPSLQSVMARDGRDPIPEDEAELAAIEQDLALGQVQTTPQLERARRLTIRADERERQAARLSKIPPEVLVAPFTVGPRNTVPVEPTPIAFFAPAVIALLLQHVAVSLAALSMVRDRLLGVLEIYRVAPIGASEVIVGKSLSFGLILILVATFLVVAIHFLLGVPFIGQVHQLILSLGLLLFASLGLGFFLATLARTETQAVQLSMLVLLASIFFGGFFIALSGLEPALRVVSYLLPVTFGSSDLRDIMLSGDQPSLSMLLGPAVLGLVMYIAAGRSLSRQINPR